MKNKNLFMEIVTYFKIRKKFWLLPIFILLLLCVPLVSAGVQEANLTSAFSFDVDGSDLVGDNHLTATGATHLTNGSCKIGAGCYEFDGSSDYLQRTSGVNEFDGLSEWSASFWIKSDDTPTTFDNNRGIFMIGSTSPASIYITGGNAVNYVETRLDTTTGDNDGSANTNAVTLNSWQHIVITWDGTTENTYVNGGVGTSDGMTGNLVTFSGYLTIGSHYFGSPANYFDGLIDDVCFWNMALNSTHVNSLYNGGTGAECYTETGAANPFILKSYSLEDDTQILIFNTTINSTDFKSTSNGSINTGLFTNDTKLYNFSVSAFNHFTNDFLSVNVSVTPQILNLTKYPHVIIYNDWNNSQLTNFSVTVNSITYSNTTGTKIYLPVTGLQNITINKSGYLLRTLEHNFTNSNDLNTTIWQSEVNLKGQEIITNNTILNWNISTVNGITTTTTQNITLKPNKGVYSWEAKSLNYWNTTNTINISEDYNNFTINFYTHLLNVSVYKLGGGLVGAVNFEVSALNYTYNISASGTGYFEFGLLNGSYFVLADPTGYNIINATFNISTNETYKAVNFTVATTNSIDFYFYDEITNALIDFQTISIELIGNYVAYNATTTTGNYFIDLVTPDTYTIRYSAPYAHERFYYFTMVNRTTNTVNLYLLNSTLDTDVTAYVYDENINYLEGAIIKTLRYDLTTNSYILQEMRATDFQGQAVLHLQQNTEFYKFVVEYPSGTVELTTTPTYISTTSLEFQLVLSEAVGSTFFNSQDITYSLTYSNSTNNFNYFFNDGTQEIAQACLFVYSVNYLSDTLYNSTCVESTSGTILINAPAINGTTYKANAFIYYNDDPYYLTSLIVTFKEQSNTGKLGLFSILLLTIVFAFMGVWSPIVATIITPIPLVLGSATNLIGLSLPMTLSIWVLSIVVGYIVSK